MKRGSMKKWAAVCLAGITILVLTACGGEETGSRNLLNNEEDNEKTVNLFGPMEKTNPDAVNVARSAFDLTIAMAEEELGLRVEYNTYTAENYEEKTYDDVTLDRARNDMDDIYLLNTVDGKLVAIPQEIVVYGLFINKDMFDQYNLALPETPEDFLECCRVFKENGIETPVGANRWWLELFVFAQAYADLYNGAEWHTGGRRIRRLPMATRTLNFS